MNTQNFLATQVISQKNYSAVIQMCFTWWFFASSLLIHGLLF